MKSLFENKNYLKLPITEEKSPRIVLYSNLKDLVSLKLYCDILLHKYITIYKAQNTPMHLIIYSIKNLEILKDVTLIPPEVRKILFLTYYYYLLLLILTLYLLIFGTSDSSYTYRHSYIGLSRQ